MIYCKDCGEIFADEDAKRNTNYVPYGLGEVPESTTVECPHCGSTALIFDATITECSQCDETICEEAAYHNEDGEPICKHCFENNEIYDSLDELL